MTNNRFRIAAVIAKPEGMDVRLVLSDGTRLNVSRLNGEDGWTVDATFKANGFPVHANGFGNRMCRAKVLTSEPASALDAALAAGSSDWLTE